MARRPLPPIPSPHPNRPLPSGYESRVPFVATPDGPFAEDELKAQNYDMAEPPTSSPVPFEAAPYDPTPETPMSWSDWATAMGRNAGYSTAAGRFIGRMAGDDVTTAQEHNAAFRNDYPFGSTVSSVAGYAPYAMAPFGLPGAIAAGVVGEGGASLASDAFTGQNDEDALTNAIVGGAGPIAGKAVQAAAKPVMNALATPFTSAAKGMRSLNSGLNTIDDAFNGTGQVATRPSAPKSPVDFWFPKAGPGSAPASGSTAAMEAQAVRSGAAAAPRTPTASREPFSDRLAASAPQGVRPAADVSAPNLTPRQQGIADSAAGDRWERSFEAWAKKPMPPKPGLVPPKSSPLGRFKDPAAREAARQSEQVNQTIVGKVSGMISSNPAHAREVAEMPVGKLVTELKALGLSGRTVSKRVKELKAQANDAMKQNVPGAGKDPRFDRNLGGAGIGLFGTLAIEESPVGEL
ncbi:MAG: hypothetical protein JXQ99_21180 [Hyphomicrobiaceae bacterium]